MADWARLFGVTRGSIAKRLVIVVIVRKQAWCAYVFATRNKAR